MNIADRIKKIANEFAPTLVEIRRYLHERPELSYEETNTTDYICSWLRKMNLELKTDYAETGVVGLLWGKKQSPVVAIRGDIDALPVEEKTSLPFTSNNPGVMHACGHDSHITAVIGAAHILSQLKEFLEGSVKFIFQPGEEKDPGGASIMTKNGVLKNPVVDVIFALHSDPRFQAAEIGCRPGPMMAEADSFSITIKGKGGHASAPHLTVDPIVIAAEVVLSLQKIRSRYTDPFEPVVLSIGKIAGGQTTNVIPDSVELVGTVRTLDRKIAQQVESNMHQILAGITSAYSASYDLDFYYGYPVTYNDPDTTQFFFDRSKEFLGEQNCHILDRPSLGSEDFAFYSQETKGVFFRLGTGNPEKGITAYWHNSHYNIDEDALPIGAGLLSYLAIKYLNHEI